MRYLTADKIFDGTRFLPDGTVLVIDETDAFRETISYGRSGKYRVERLEGVLTPGFVNAHCHLELSHLKGSIPRHTGLPDFARAIISRRGGSSPDEMLAHMRQADLEMTVGGIVAVGDISNTSHSIPVKKQSAIRYHTFVELIGLAPERNVPVFLSGLETLNTFKQVGLTASLAPHAPYSTSNALIKQIAEYNRIHGIPFSIHNQESEEENRFFMGEKNGFDDLYRFLNLDISWFKAPRQSSLKNYGAFLPGGASLLVHNTFTGREDIDAVSDKRPYWCFCPGANEYIENRAPDYRLFKGLEDFICLGTDSLASNAQLDIMAEANSLYKTGLFPEAAILKMLTLNGARALGLEADYGSFLPGKNTGLNLVSINNTQLQFIQKII